MTKNTEWMNSAMKFQACRKSNRWRSFSFQLTRLPQNVAGRQRGVESDISWIFGIFFALFASKYDLFNLTTFQNTTISGYPKTGKISLTTFRKLHQSSQSFNTSKSTKFLRVEHVKLVEPVAFFQGWDVHSNAQVQFTNLLTYVWESLVLWFVWDASDT